MGVRRRRPSSRLSAAAPLPPKSHRPWLQARCGRAPTPNQARTFDSPISLVSKPACVVYASIHQFRRRYDRRCLSPNPIASHGPRWFIALLHEKKTLFEWNRPCRPSRPPIPETRIRSVIHVMMALMARWWRRLTHSRAFGAGNSAFQRSVVVTNRMWPVREQFRPASQPRNPRIERRRQRSVPQAAQPCPVRTTTRWCWNRLVAPFRLSRQHITTHAYVILGGERADPRSFDGACLWSRGSRPSGCSARLERIWPTRKRPRSTGQIVGLSCC